MKRLGDWAISVFLFVTFLTGLYTMTVNLAKWMVGR